MRDDVPSQWKAIADGESKALRLTVFAAAAHDEGLSSPSFQPPCEREGVFAP